MAFSGQRYRIGLSETFNGNEDLQAVPPGQLITGSRNLNTHNGGAEKRGGTANVGSQITSSLESLGSGMLIKRSGGSKHRYWAGDNGEVYRDGSSILSGRNTTAYTNLTVGNDKMFICNGIDGVQVDTGSAVAAITTAASDWTGSVHPKAMTVHSKEASRRMFAWGVSGKEDTLYYSSTGDFEVFNGGTSGTVVVDTGRGDGITNCISKDGTLWIFTKRDIFILDDSSTTVANWGVYKAPISGNGGCYSPRHAVIINNSIFAMNEEAEIYEVVTATQLREFKRASIIEPFFVHTFFDKECDISKIAQWHLNYEPETRSLRVFFVRNGYTVVDSNLAYYVNQGKWAPPHDGYDNLNDSGLYASSSYLGENSAGFPKLYTQDYDGQEWILEETTKSDNSNAYKDVLMTPWMTFDLPGIEKRYVFATLHYKSMGTFDIDFRWFVDDEEQTTSTFTTGGSGAVLDSFVLDTDTLGAIGISKDELPSGQVGEKFQVQLSNDGAGNDYLLSHLIVGFVPRGIQRL